MLEVDHERQLSALMRLARDLLEVDVAALTEITDGREVVRRVAGSWPTLESLEGSSLPLSETFCQRMLDGRIGNIVPDVAADQRVNELLMAQTLGVRAWMGVPIRLANEQLYVLCCLAREARPDYGEPELRLLLGLAESVLVHLRAQ
jgi:GAF domain-containing protein